MWSIISLTLIFFIYYIIIGPAINLFDLYYVMISTKTVLTKHKVSKKCINFLINNFTNLYLPLYKSDLVTLFVFRKVRFRTKNSKSELSFGSVL